MSCPDCESAIKDPDHGIYRRDCRRCEVRMMSHAPRFIREQFYASIPEAEREQFRADVLGEYTRRQAVRRAVG